MSGSLRSAGAASTTEDRPDVISRPGGAAPDESLIDTDVLSTAELDAAIRRSGATAPSTPSAPATPSGRVEDAPAAPRRTPLPGAVEALLRSAVTLQAEDLLRTVGALAQSGRDVREWSGLVERDARDLALLTACAAASGSRLPAGLDAGGGDPERPGSVIEGLLASHEALTDVLGQLVRRCTDARIRSTATAVLDRRQEEAAVLRGLGAGEGLPQEVRLVRGALPKYQA